MYKIKIISLDNCVFSDKAIKILNKNNIKYDQIKINSKTKDKYLNEKIKTFPQIYLTKKTHPDKLLIGGYIDIYNIINVINKKSFKSAIDYLSKYKWAKKTKLRLIEIFTKKN